MDCPHCGGAIDAGRPKPIEHACFDDRWHAIVVGLEVRMLTVSQWRLLQLLRARFRRFVPVEFLAQWSAPHPRDGGDPITLRLMVMRVRVLLKGSPFAIANEYGHGYGLFPLAEVEAIEYRGRRGHRTRAIERAPATTMQQWADQPSWRLAQFPELQQAAAEAAAARDGQKPTRHPRRGPLFRSFRKD
jgi:hypothetical protein